VKDDLAHELARMAVDLHEQPDVERTAERFIEYALTTLATRHASVVLIHRGGRLEPAVSTDTLVEEAEQAFAVLHRYSQDNNVRLREVAQRLIRSRKLS
jgi:hypothetical protein